MGCLLLSGGDVKRSTAATGCLSAWVVLMWATQQRPHLAATRTNGEAILSWRPWHRFGFPTALAFPLPLILAVAEKPSGREGVALYVGLLLLCVAAWVVLQQLAGERFLLSDAAIERISPWTGKRLVVAWNTIRVLRFDEYHRFLIVNDRGRRVGVGHRIDGIGDFAVLALQHLPEVVLRDSADARAMLEQIAALLKRP